MSCINFPAFNDRTAALLAKLSDNIVWLRLDNTQLSDEGLEAVGQLKQLVRLNLAGTGISSSGINKLKNLSHLEYINLTATKVNDAGLQTLASLPSLQQIYCWQSLMTEKWDDCFPEKQAIGSSRWWCRCKAMGEFLKSLLRINRVGGVYNIPLTLLRFSPYSKQNAAHFADV